MLESIIDDNRILPRPQILRGEANLLQAMLVHWVHQDRLYWDQVRYLLQVQTAFIAAWYVLGVSLFGVLTLLASAIMSIYFYNLAEGIRGNRDVNLETIRILSKIVVSSDTEALLNAKKIFEIFGFTTFPLLPNRADRGAIYQAVLFWIPIFIDIVLGLATLHDLYCSSGNMWLSFLHQKFSLR